MDNRPDKLARVMMDTELASVWSTCSRLKVATTITDHDFVTVVTGRNGAPINEKHCNSYDKPQVNAEGRCIICLHSERNAINKAAKNGVRLEGLNLFTLYRPCMDCANSIVQVRIGALYYRHDYDTDGQRDRVLNMLNNQLAFVRQLPMTNVELDFSTMLQQWRQTWA